MKSRIAVALLFAGSIGTVVFGEASRYPDVPINPHTKQPLSAEAFGEYYEECIVEDCSFEEQNEIYDEDQEEGSGGGVEIGSVGDWAGVAVGAATLIPGAPPPP